MSLPQVEPPLDILPLRNGWPVFKHVLKHLYDRAERWDLIVPALPVDLRARALREGCGLLDAVQGGDERPRPVGGRCARLLKSDHDAYYRPAYEHSMRTARALGRLRLRGDRFGFLGDNGVFVFATDASDGRPARVVSAYRKALDRPETRTAREYVDAAVRKWSDKKALLARPPKKGESP